MKYMNGSEAFLHRFLRGFIRDFATAPQQLEDHLCKGNIEAILALSHSVKSVAAYIGALKLTEAAAKLEQATRKGETSEIPQIAGEFRCHLLLVLGAIEAYFRHHPSSPDEDEFI